MGCLLFVANDANFFLSHRLPIASAAMHLGYEVHVATARSDEAQEKLKRMGFAVHSLPLVRRGMNPLFEIRTILAVHALCRQLQPRLVHLVTIKPLLYGGLATRLTGVPAVVGAVTGLGYVQAAQGLRGALLRAMVRVLGKVSLKGSQVRVIFQNPDDLAAFIGMNLIRKEQAVLIRGSGVDTKQFFPIPEPYAPPLVVLASRMLWDKGIPEFVIAAERLKSAGVKARFALVGDSDPESPTAIPAEQLCEWQRQGFVEWWGMRTDMPNVFAQAHVVCLPTRYGEGVPKVLIEAAACGRPIVTTDVPGCREIVRNGENGVLVPSGDVDGLAQALFELISDPDLRNRMGQRGRTIAVAEFSVEQVVDDTMRLYRELAPIPA